MTKILNLDKFQTKKDKVIVLGGVEHTMKTFTVKDYILHMRKANEIIKSAEEGDELDRIDAGLSATVHILTNAFPTVKKSQFEALSMEQLNSVRLLVEDTTEEDAEGLGEETGKTV